MANITDIKSRIKGINDTRQITKAMELISVTKVKRLQEYFDKNLSYFKSLTSVMKDLLSNNDGDHPYFERKLNGKDVFIVVSSDKGLSGGYNHNILNFALEKISASKDREVITFGRIASEFLKRNDIDVSREFVSTSLPTLKLARELAFDICHNFEKGLVAETKIIFTDVDEKGNQEPKEFHILPIQKEEFNSDNRQNTKLLFDPSPKEVLDHLIPQYVIGLLFTVLIHASLSEHKARMVAMESATRNADEMLEKLRIEYNRARQENITNELLEIISGSNLTNG